MTETSFPYDNNRRSPRIAIISDISNEPDDAQSLCRYLLYSNQFRSMGLVACTSTWMREEVHPEAMHRILDAYGSAYANLAAHVSDDMKYPSAAQLKKLVRTGPAVYGLKALEADVPLSDGSRLLIDTVDESEEPLWVLAWGGTNTIAQALQYVHDTESRSDHDVQRFRSKLRVYAISDQDDTGAWIRRKYPDIFYIASVHGWNQYGMAAWTGISGDRYYNFDQGGPDFTTMTESWIKANIQIGPLGAAYPDYLFIPEGDTPTFLYLIQNGLGDPEHPEWGSWGGRYVKSYEDGSHYSDVTDSVVGKNGQTFTSSQATIWRWREAFQHDFAARIKWTMTDNFKAANHAPCVSVNGSGHGPEPIFLEAEASSSVILDARRSYDPDEGDLLTFTWTQYREPTATQWWVDAEVSTLHIENLDDEIPGRKVKVTLPPPGKCAVNLHSRVPAEKGQILHLILEVKDNGTPALVTYKRVLIQCMNKDLKTDTGDEGNPFQLVMDKIASLRSN